MTRRLVRRLGAALALLAPAACLVPTDPKLPANTERISPPAEYRMWWRMTEACSGRTADFTSMQWYVVRGRSEFRVDGRTAAGYFSAPGNRIVMAEGALHDGSVARHEMLHALLRDTGHRRDAFLERCGGVVACAVDCVRDAGPGARPAVDAGQPEVTEFDLELGVDTSAINVRSVADSGFFTVALTVRNPFDHEVVASLADIRFDDGLTRKSFFLEAFPQSADTSSHTVFWTTGSSDARAFVFAAGETKRQLFDLRVGTPADGRPDGLRVVAAGEHLFGGSYGARAIPLVAVHIRP